MPSYPTPDPRNVKRISGEFYYRLIRDGVIEPAFKSLGNSLSGTLAHNVTKEDLPDRLQPGGGKYVEEITEKEGTLTLRLSEHAMHVLATSFLATLETVAGQAALAGQTLAVDPSFGVHFLDRHHITVTGVAQSATPLVVNVDYRVLDAAIGSIEFIEGGLVLDTGGVDVTVTFTQEETEDWQRLSGYVETALELQAKFIDRSSRGPKQHYTFFRMGVEPGQFDMLAEGFAQFDLVLNLLSDADGNYGGSAGNPFYKIEEHPVAVVGS